MIRSCLLAAVLVAALSAALSAQAPEANPLDVEIAFLEARVSRDEADPITPTRLGHAYLRRAKAAGTFSDYRKAETSFRLALTRSAEHFGALTGLANALAARHAFDEAYEVGRRAIKANPDAADGYAVAGDAALEAGKVTEAAALFDRVAQLAPGYHAHTRAANLAAARGDTRGAYASLAKAAADAPRLNLDPERRAWPHIRTGSIAFDHGDWKRAESSYTAALGITPENPVALEHLAELRAAQKQFAQARELYARAIAADPRPEYHEAVGNIHAAEGRQDDARAAFDRARRGYLAAVEEGDPGAYRRLALFFADIEPNPAEAVKWARKDFEIRTDAVTLGVLAWTLMKAGQGEEAQRIAERAAKAAPVDAMTWQRIGGVAEQAGDAALARARFARATEINPRLKTSSPPPRGRG